MTDLAEQIGTIALKSIADQRKENAIRKKQLGERIIALLCDEKIINYTALRNEQVKKIYFSLRTKGHRAKEARIRISRMPFTDLEGNIYYLAEDNLRKILYPPKNQSTKK